MSDLAKPADVPEKRDALLRLLDCAWLRLALGDAVDVGGGGYGLTWPGKAECFKTIQVPSLGTLRLMRGESVDFDTTENLIHRGRQPRGAEAAPEALPGQGQDDLHRPPYNARNDFMYPDNYTESLQTSKPVEVLPGHGRQELPDRLSPDDGPH